MRDTTATRVAPPWSWKVTLGSAALALVSHLAGGASTERITGVLTAITLVGTVYLLYKWGQQRRPASNDGDGDSRRRKELKAEAGGYGGNGGGD